MAGLGTRLRPHTWSKPKQLVSVAGKAVLDHVLESLSSLPDPDDIEVINIVGYLGDQIEGICVYTTPISMRFVVEDPRAVSCGQIGARVPVWPDVDRFRRYMD
jgi:NDP-sugar pyrophosphorylase family protein